MTKELPGDCGKYIRCKLIVYLVLIAVPVASKPIAAQRITSLVSTNGAGRATGNGASATFTGVSSSVASADGRYVVFISSATDLVSINTSLRQVYVRDLVEGTTTLVSINRAGTAGGNLDSFNPSISANGRFVAFDSFASDLVDNDANSTLDLFVRDLVLGTTELVTVNLAGFSSLGLFGLDLPQISSDGRFVLFQSPADDLVGNDNNNANDLFVRDLVTHTTTLVSVNRFGVSSPEAPSFDNRCRDLPPGHDCVFEANYWPVMTPDGRFVAFRSEASDLVENDTVCPGGPCNGKNSAEDIFLRALSAGITTLVDLNRLGVAGGNFGASESSISADGRFIAFRSFSTDLVTNDTTPQADVYVRDTVKGITTLVSVNSAGTNGGSNGAGSGVNSYNPYISPDGRFVAFSSVAVDLAPNKTNILPFDLFVRDLHTNTTKLVSANRDGNDGGRDQNISSVPYAFNADGRFLVFESNAGDLVENDTNEDYDVFIRDLATGAVIPANVNIQGEISGTGESFSGAISADGRISVFSSTSSDLVANDTNGASDVFVRTIFEGNPADDPRFFVRQHYLDFLGRKPDQGGLDYWTDQITQCDNDKLCVHSRRIGVSAAFFIELEFQDTGYYVYRFYKASFGRQPSYTEFSSDRSKVVGGSSLEASKQAFADEWVQREVFRQAYPTTMSNTDIINKLFDTAGLTASTYDAQRQQEIDALNAGRSRALVLRDLIEIADFKNIPNLNDPRYIEIKRTSQYNPAFVLMQYFGYLRRDVDQGGYEFWLDVVNNREPNDYRGMVCAFITSAEYQLRFGSLVTRNNADCAQ